MHEKPRPNRATRIIAAASCALVATLLTSPNAHAAEDEWTVGGGLVVASIPTQANGIVGVGAKAHVRYGFTPSLSLTFGALFSHHFGRPGNDEETPIEDQPLDIVIPRVGLSYALDVIDLVPYVMLDATMYAASASFYGSEDAFPLGVGVLAGLGVDYRRWRDLSFGIEIAYHAFLTDISDYPVYIHFGFHASWHSDPF